MTTVHGTKLEELEVPYLASPLESEELMAIEKRRLEAQGIVKGVEDVRVLTGRYKVEVHMHHKRSMQSAFVGRIYTLIKARQFGGGGDMPMFACGNDRCPGFIHPNDYSPTAGFAICPICQIPWKIGANRFDVKGAHGDGRALTDVRNYILTNQHWATAITRTFIRLGQDADIVIQYFSEKLIAPTLEAKQNAKLGHDQINRSRSLRRKVVYPLGNILQDLSNGASLESRIHAFITA